MVLLIIIIKTLLTSFSKALQFNLRQQPQPQMHSDMGQGQRSQQQADASDSEADEARSCQVARHEIEDDQHDHQLNRDQQHADAHAGLKRDGVARERLSTEARKRRARVRPEVRHTARVVFFLCDGICVRLCVFYPLANVVCIKSRSHH